MIHPGGILRNTATGPQPPLLASNLEVLSSKFPSGPKTSKLSERRSCWEDDRWDDDGFEAGLTRHLWDRNGPIERRVGVPANGGSTSGAAVPWSVRPSVGSVCGWDWLERRWMTPGPGMTPSGDVWCFGPPISIERASHPLESSKILAPVVKTYSEYRQVTVNPLNSTGQSLISKANLSFPSRRMVWNTMNPR